MTTFSRTASGIANYHKFHDADFTAYIEGKSDEDETDALVKTNDIFYYEFLLRAANPEKKPKVKCVGNKENALAYAKIIREGGVQTCVVIVDKDLEGVTSSPMDLTPVIRTYGYSWENELWTANTISAVLDDLTNGHPRSSSEVTRHLPSLASRLKYLSLLDAASQTNGGSLLSKRSALCGISFRFPNVSSAEVRRIGKIFRSSAAFNCPIARQIVRSGSQIDAREVIQGHFWSNVALRFAADLYKKITGDHIPSNAALTRLALSHLRRNPTDAVGLEIVSRYRTELARCGV